MITMVAYWLLNEALPNISELSLTFFNSKDRIKLNELFKCKELIIQLEKLHKIVANFLPELFKTKYITNNYSVWLLTISYSFRLNTYKQSLMKVAQQTYTVAPNQLSDLHCPHPYSLNST